MKTTAEMLKEWNHATGVKLVDATGHQYTVKRLDADGISSETRAGRPAGEHYLMDERDVIFSPYVLRFVTIPGLKVMEKMVEVYKYAYPFHGKVEISAGYYDSQETANVACVQKAQRLDWTVLSVPESTVRDGRHDP